MLTLTAAVVFTGLSASKPDVAFVARYYFQGKRKSNYQIYVSNHDGTGRRQLTFGNVDIESATWIDSAHLTYTVSTNEHQVKDTYLRDVTVRVIDVQTGADKKIAEYKGVNFIMSGKKVAVTTGATTKSFEITAYGMKPTAPLIEQPYVDFGYVPTKEGDPENPTPRKVTLSTPGGAYEFNWAFDFDRMEYTAGDSIVVSGKRAGVPFEIHVLGHDVKDIQRHKEATYIITGPAFTKFENPSFVYQWQDNAPDPKLIASKIGSIEFKAEDDFWFGDDIENRRLMPLKDGRVVYVSSLYCGNWKTGKRWTLATGLVSVYGASMRPKA